jgi:hypothetical protein
VWEWDGASWVQITTAVSPPPRLLAGLAYHVIRGTAMLFGGITQTQTPYGDLWEWDGTTWRSIDTVQAVSPRYGAQLVYDAIHARLDAFGGTLTDVLDDGWIMEFASASSPRDRCEDTDTDGDGLAACQDPDCWARCTPQCPPGLPCNAQAPRCGDGVCSLVENTNVCPGDCP